MESRPYFVVGDIVASVTVGILTAVFIAWLFDPAWHMVARMAAGMIAGMLIAVALALIVFSPLFGAMEIFVPTMLTGMVTGMSVGMWLVTGAGAVTRGAVIGIACLSFVYAANSALVRRGPRKA